jgi:hypothetical protein
VCFYKTTELPVYGYIKGQQEGIYVPPQGFPHLDFVVYHDGEFILVPATVAGTHAYDAENKDVKNITARNPTFVFFTGHQPLKSIPQRRNKELIYNVVLSPKK